MKKLLSIIALAALVVPAVPASASTTFGSPTVNVNWNVTASGSITLYADYATGTTLCGTESTGCGTPAVLQAPASGAGSCTAAPSAPTANTGAAGSTTGVFFGNIAPDLTNKNTVCYYKDAVDAVISTNDSAGYTLYEDISVAATNAAGYALCEVANGTVPTAGATGSSVAAVPTGFNATGAVSCPTTPAMTQVSTTSKGTTAANGSSTISNGHVGQDYALVVPALAAAGASQFTVTYTFVGT